MDKNYGLLRITGIMSLIMTGSVIYFTYFSSNTSIKYSESSVGLLLDARNDYAHGIARPLVTQLVDAILYIKELDKDLADYGVTINGNQYLFVEIEGVTYKVGIDKVN